MAKERRGPEYFMLAAFFYDFESSGSGGNGLGWEGFHFWGSKLKSELVRLALPFYLKR